MGNSGAMYLADRQRIVGEILDEIRQTRTRGHEALTWPTKVEIISALAARSLTITDGPEAGGLLAPTLAHVARLLEQLDDLELDPCVSCRRGGGNHTRYCSVVASEASSPAGTPRHQPLTPVSIRS